MTTYTIATDSGSTDIQAATASEAMMRAARATVEAAGAAGGIDEVRRLAERGWPESRELDNDSQELRLAIQAEARRIVQDA